jgi:CO/xanthine dehydrogenase FAD-binding subunit
MNIDTIREIKRPSSAQEIRQWRPGYAWLGGGTWLYSEQQPALDTLIDLGGLNWPAREASESGLDIAATCRIVELHDFEGPAEWRALPLIRLCCDSFLASFKIWNAATIGGNIVMSLPAGPMISLVSALEGRLTLWPLGGEPREVAIVDFVTGNHANLLRPGELVRSIHLPAAALKKRYAFRRASLTHLGRSAALIVGTQAEGGELLLTVTAATPRPIQIRFATPPSTEELRDAIDARLPAEGYFDDVHGSAPYKRHLTCYFAEQIRAELASGGTKQ